jgi:methyl-accepting chemotaxis protein
VTDKIQNATDRIQRANLVSLILSVLLFLGCLRIMGDLNSQYLIVSIALIILSVFVFVINRLAAGNLIGSIAAVIDSDGIQIEAQIELRKKITGYAAKRTAINSAVWAVAIIVLVLSVNYFVLATVWQLSVLCVLAIATAMFHIVCCYQFTQKAISAIVGEIGQDIGGRDRGSDNAASGFASKALVTYLVISFVGLGLCAFCWTSRARTQFALQVIEEKRPVFTKAATHLSNVFQQKAKADLKKILDKISLGSKSNNGAVVVNRVGKVLAESAFRSFDPKWFEKLVQEENIEWETQRAPFLYLHKKIAPQKYLFWVGNISVVDSKVASLGWVLFVSVIILLVLGSFPVWSLVSGHAKSIEQISEKLSSDTISADFIYGDAELKRLYATVAQMSAKIGQVAGDSAGKNDQLITGHKRLRDQVLELRHTAEKHTDIAEETATSVVEMRSSIQSISEQVESLNSASSDCSTSMFEIDQSIREVASAAENLQNLIDDNTSSVTQMTTSMSQVAQNIDELAKAAENTVSSIAVIDNSIKQVEDNTSQTHKLSEEVSELASRGAGSVRETIAGINDIQEITSEAQEVINSLGTQMEAVGKILTVIGDVAEQTNLLALNAAIIAAAAGEHGKGFAVVADEIKDLADRTSTSTKEISGLIKSVQSETRRAMDAMQRGSGSVMRGVELANNAGEALKQILASVQQVNEMANNIAKTTSEHSGITRDITASMTSISGMVREIKRAVVEQSRGGARINRASEQMSDHSKFVYRSANDQVQAVAGVSKTMERISEMVAFVSKAMNEQNNGVNHVAKVAEEVRDTLEQERAKYADLEESTNIIGQVIGDFGVISGGNEESGGIG